jgi:hypothetical protein
VAIEPKCHSEEWLCPRPSGLVFSGWRGVWHWERLLGGDDRHWDELGDEPTGPGREAPGAAPRIGDGRPEHTTGQHSPLGRRRTGRYSASSDMSAEVLTSSSTSVEPYQPDLHGEVPDRSQRFRPEQKAEGFRDSSGFPAAYEAGQIAHGTGPIPAARGDNRFGTGPLPSSPWEGSRPQFDSYSSMNHGSGEGFPPRPGGLHDAENQFGGPAESGPWRVPPSNPLGRYPSEAAGPIARHVTGGHSAVPGQPTTGAFDLNPGPATGAFRVTPISGVVSAGFRPRTSSVTNQDRFEWANRFGVVGLLVGFVMGLLNANLQDVTMYEGRYTTLWVGLYCGLFLWSSGFLKPHQVRQKYETISARLRAMVSD